MSFVRMVCMEFSAKYCMKWQATLTERSITLYHTLSPQNNPLVRGQRLSTETEEKLRI